MAKVNLEKLKRITNFYQEFRTEEKTLATVLVNYGNYTFYYLPVIDSFQYLDYGISIILKSNGEFVIEQGVLTADIADGLIHISKFSRL